MYVKYVAERDDGLTKRWAKDYIENLNQLFKVKRISATDNCYVVETPADWCYRITPAEIFLPKECFEPPPVDKELEDYL